MTKSIQYSHPNLADIQAYTAVRLGCSIDNLQSGSTVIVPAVKPEDPNFMEPYAVTKPDVICIHYLAQTTLIRVHPTPSDAVQKMLAALGPGGSFTEEWLLALEGTKIKRYSAEPYFYLDPADFNPFTADSDKSVFVRELTQDDKSKVAALHETLPEKMRWFVEIDHPIVFGCFEDETLVAVSSLFLFNTGRIAAAGVQTHAHYRQLGYGKMVVSAVVQWAIERNWTCEWSSWEENPASISLCTALGFKEHSVETEYQIS